MPRPTSSRCADGLRGEQVGAQLLEVQALGARPGRRPVVDAVVAGSGPVGFAVDEPEQHVQRVVQVGARPGARRGEVDQGQVAQPVEAVALLVLQGADRQHAELGRGLGVEQEQDPVEEPQRLPGQHLRLVGRQRRQALVAAGDGPPRWR